MSIFLVVNETHKVGDTSVEGQQIRVDLTSYNLWPQGFMFSLSLFSFLNILVYILLEEMVFLM